jgi:hypothetical protein
MPRMTITEWAQTLAAYFAIPTVLLYPFGYFALFTQFYKYFSLEFYTAWYATSLANRLMVIGVGVTILLVPLIGSVLFTWLVSQLLCRHSDRVGWGSFGRSHGLVVKLASVSALVFVLHFLWTRILTAGRMSCLAIVGRGYNEPAAEAARHQLSLNESVTPTLIFVAGGLLGGRLILASYRKYRQTEYERLGLYPETGYNGLRFFSNGITQGWLLSGLVVAYITAITAALFLVYLMPGFMPFMDYGKVTGLISERGEHPDRYLSFAEGRWHVIHRYHNKKGTRWYGILTLSEGTVRDARVIPLGLSNPRVAPLPWPKDADQKWCGAGPPPPPNKQ